MNESVNNEIIALWHAATPIRQIARRLRVSRKRVRRVIQAHLKQREGALPPPDLPKPPERRPSKLDEYGPLIDELVERYKDLTATRLLEELQARGFQGGYTIVRELLREKRPRPRTEPVVRFETRPGGQAQMDFSPYEIGFLAEGRRLVHCFSYVLGYSRRFYIHFVEKQDFETTLREHVRAFEYLDGVATTCLYDNFKVVVVRYEDEEPIYNTRFLAFATHYGFRPWACRRRRSQTKGKVERRFSYVEKNLLNGRTFRTLDHLNEFTRQWLVTNADARPHPKRKPMRVIEVYEEERPHLLPLPATPYDTAQVVYRTVSSEGFIQYAHNFYPVPWHRIGETLPVRITERELIVYGSDLSVVAQHPLFPCSVTGETLLDARLHPPDRACVDVEALRSRFENLGEDGSRFFEGLIGAKRCGKAEAVKVLALLGIYRKNDLVAALSRAVRYRAFSLSAVERILTAQARPKSKLEHLAEEAKEHLGESLKQDPVPPRQTGEYQKLLFEEPDDQPSKAVPPSECPDAPDESSKPGRQRSEGDPTEDP